MKKRKGFSEIVLPGGSFGFAWGHNSDREVVLILYTPQGKRLVIPFALWYNVEDSPEYLARASPTWRGKQSEGRKKCSSFWCCGKAEVRELYRKYLTLNT